MRERGVGIQPDIPLASAEHDPHMPQVVEVPRIAQLRQVVHRVVEVDVVVVIALQELADVEGAAHADQVRHLVGMAQRHVHRVIAAEAAAGDRHPPAAGVGARMLEDLLHDDLLVGHVGLDAVGGMDAVVVPALRVDAVGTIELHPPGVHERRGRLDQAEVLVLVVPSLGCREQHHRDAGVPEREHLEDPSSQVGSAPAQILFPHSRSCTPHPEAAILVARWPSSPTSRQGPARVAQPAGRPVHGHSWYEYPAPRSAVSTDLAAPPPPPPRERDLIGATPRERDLTTTTLELDPSGTPRERDPIVTPRERGVALALLGVAVALRLLGVWEYRFNSDEPQHAHVVWGWNRGLVQYRDFFDNHTPLFHMLWAPLLAAFGESVRTLFWLLLTVLALYLAALAVTWLIGRRLLSPRAALWGTVLTALLPPFFVKTLEFRTDVPWTLLWLVAFQVATRGAPGPARLFVVGLAVGAAAAVALQSSLLLACLLGSALAAAAWRLAGGHGTSLRPT